MGRPHDDDVPGWVPSWAPSKGTVDYVSSGLTALLLAGVTIYLALHLLRGGRPGIAATTAAGVGVGGAGT